MIRKEEERKKSFQKSHIIKTVDILKHILLEHIFLCMCSYMDLQRLAFSSFKRNHTIFAVLLLHFSLSDYQGSINEHHCIIGSRGFGRGHGNPCQYSYLENLMDRGAWQATVHRVAKSWTQLKQHSMHILLYGCVIILFNQFRIVRL